MARDASTYRGARRNACIRELKQVWGPNWYYPDWARGTNILPSNNAAIYVPRKAREGAKPATTSNSVHALLKRGDYAGAVRKVFSRRSTGIGGGAKQ